jgi:CubicO group peptidase (beta-lactamase class C family)
LHAQPINTLIDLEGYLDKLVNFGSPPGMSLAVVKKDRIIYSKGFGWADRPREIHATPETVYHWWSITKIATAIAILQLQEQGRLQLDDPVTKFLPFFKVQYTSVTSRAITIRNLLNHGSGLPNVKPFRLMRWIHHHGDPHPNQTALVIKVLPMLSKLAFEPGEHTAYTNFGYMVLGAIIEKITNGTYEDYIRQNILQPLGMKSTDFIYTEEMEPFEAAGTHPVFDIWTPLIPFICRSYVRETFKKNIWLKRVYTDQTSPTGLIGSVTDAARLVIAYFNKSELDGRHILSEQSVATMTSESHIKGKEEVEDPKITSRQGIGWQVYKGRGGQILKHGGGGIGFRTIMQLYPDEKLGFILFANGTYVEDWKIMNLIASLSW